jgi:hypothetical protein
VTYCQVWIPGNGEQADAEIPPGYVSVAILGGDPTEIATVMRRFIVPGISTYGNEMISATVDGYCRSMHILRPILVPVKLIVYVKVGRDMMGCPPPSLLAIRDTLYAGLKSSMRNGDDITYFRIRSIIEAAYPNVEVTAFYGHRDSAWSDYNAPVNIAFVEMADVALEDIEIRLADPLQPIPVPPPD